MYVNFHGTSVLNYFEYFYIANHWEVDVLLLIVISKNIRVVLSTSINIHGVRLIKCTNNQHEYVLILKTVF